LLRASTKKVEKWSAHGIRGDLEPKAEILKAEALKTENRGQRTESGLTLQGAAGEMGAG